MARPLILVAHPSPDLYGSDRQLLETVDALLADDWRVQVVLPSHGPLVELLQRRPVHVVVEDFPVLRRSSLNVPGMIRLTFSGAAAVLRLGARIRRARPAAVLVNTLTIPFWLLAARAAGTPAGCHVHEAEDRPSRLVRRALAAPLQLAGVVIANSGATRRTLTEVLPGLHGRTVVVHNGVSGPAEPVPPLRARRAGDPAVLSLVGRLSPIKGVDVALEALSLLRREGRVVVLKVCGTVYPGYEWYEQTLRERAARADLVGCVEFAGYVHPTWPVLADSDVVLAPSTLESFGNAAVEAMLAGRPVVASAVQGLQEVISPDRTGILVPPRDPQALAAAVADLLDHPRRAADLAEAGMADARTRFSSARYGQDMRAVMSSLTGRTSSTPLAGH